MEWVLRNLYDKRERAEKEVEEMMNKIRNANFKKYDDWEEFVPEWICILWPKLTDGFKILI